MERRVREAQERKEEREKGPNYFPEEEIKIKMRRLQFSEGEESLAVTGELR